MSLLALVFIAGIGPVAAQQPAALIDTTVSYPWRLSYFPYVTAEPVDGVMGVARAVAFRQSRWDSRRSVEAQVSLDAGYSTNDAWLVRLRGDFPAIAHHWRLQVAADAAKSNQFEISPFGEIMSGHEQRATVEITREIAGPLKLAARGNIAHFDGLSTWIAPYLTVVDPVTQTDRHARLAAVIDVRDREYDTRRGALLQAGIEAGRTGGPDHEGDGNYNGWYALATGWVPLGAKTVITARAGARALSSAANEGVEAIRTISAWEDDIVVLGGPESNRGLSPAEMAGRGMLLASGEVRQRIFNAPGAALSVIGFVDAGRAFADVGCPIDAGSEVRPDLVGPFPCNSSGKLSLTLHDWTVAPGGGFSLRLLRNAVLTATLAHTEGKTRGYIVSGFSW